MGRILCSVVVADRRGNAELVQEREGAMEILIFYYPLDFGRPGRSLDITDVRQEKNNCSQIEV